MSANFAKYSSASGSSLLLLALAVSGPVMAEEDFNLWQEEEVSDSGSEDFSFGFAEDSEPEPVTNFHYNQLEAGATWLDSDSFMYGRYNGLDGQGWYPLLDWSLGMTRDPDSGYFYDIRLQLAGPDAKTFQLDWGNAAYFEQSIDYSRSQYYGNSSGYTPFVNPGNETLELPVLWEGGMTTGDMSGLDEPLTPLIPVLQRDRFALSHSQKLSPLWRFNLDFAAEKKEGIKTSGNAIYFNVANPYGVVLPEPVNYRTNDIGLGFSYHGERLQASAGYSLSLFDNHRDRTAWQNPYEDVISSAVDYPNGFGAKDQPADNQHHLLRTSGGYRLSERQRLEWDLSWGLSLQDETYEPYSVNEELLVSEPLPADDLNGEVSSINADLAWLITPVAKLQLDTRFRHRSRDNNTPRHEYLYIRGDGQNQPASVFGVYNYRVGRKSNELSTQARYRLDSAITLKGGYEFEQVERRNYAVNRNKEDRYMVGIRSRSFEKVTIDIDYQHADRYASEYQWDYDFFALHNAEWINTLPDNQRYINHPLLKQFPVANREQDQWDISLQTLFNPAWSLNARFRGQWQDYDSTVLGLRSRDNLSANLQTNYAASDRWSVYAYAHISEQNDEQDGLQFRPGADKAYNDISVPLFEASDSSRSWRVKADTTAVSLGLGGEFHITPDKLTLVLDYVMTDTEADYHVSDAGAADITTSNLPQASTRMHQLISELRYQWDPVTELRFGYGYYRYEEDDWAYDTLQVDSIDNVISTGQKPANESINRLTTTIVYAL
ncbi:MAG: MtrB/PioB family decaheme-associated outer membrane protein [Ketobacteraceae bacterium]|nr:MtrB/PioB family decaheme-associated outer membrane protein [Ketobacteraceae bacterium]